MSDYPPNYFLPQVESYNVPIDQRLASDANLLKNTIKESKVLQEFSIDGNNKPNFINGRVVFPSLDPKLGFSIDKMVAGIITGDFVEGSDQVRTYYPHVRENQTKGVTVFNMNIDDAAKILSECAARMNMTNYDIQSVLRRYTDKPLTGIPEIDQVHENDIAYALNSKFQNTQ